MSSFGGINGLCFGVLEKGNIFTLCVCSHLGEGGTYLPGGGGGVPTFPGLDGGGGYLLFQVWTGGVPTFPGLDGGGGTYFSRSGRGGTYFSRSGWGGVPTFPGLDRGVPTFPGLDGGGTYLPGRYPPSPRVGTPSPPAQGRYPPG